MNVVENYNYGVVLMYVLNVTLTGLIMIKCNLCEQEFNENDPLIEIRKSRHEMGIHSMNRTIYSERDGSASKPMGNHIYGNVTWITL